MGEYYYVGQASSELSDVVERVRRELQAEGFGVLTEIDVKATMKKKLDVDMPDYLILGACNPHFAYRALQVESMIGSMLPCNVVIRVDEDGDIQVAAVDPIASMASVENPALFGIAEEVRDRLRRVVDRVVG